MLEIAQFGAGRIGQIHASNIAASKNARLAAESVAVNMITFVVGFMRVIWRHASSE